jgi:hypothetical protein
VVRSTMGLITILLTVILCCASAHSQQTQRGQTSSIREIIPGHYMFSSGVIFTLFAWPQKVSLDSANEKGPLEWGQSTPWRGPPRRTNEPQRPRHGKMVTMA